MNMQAYIQALGPLASLYNDPEVNEIMVDAFDKIIVDRHAAERPQPVRPVMHQLDAHFGDVQRPTSRRPRACTHPCHAG